LLAPSSGTSISFPRLNDLWIFLLAPNIQVVVFLQRKLREVLFYTHSTRINIPTPHYLPTYGSIGTMVRPNQQQQPSSGGAQSTPLQNAQVVGFRGRSNNPYNGKIGNEHPEHLRGPGSPLTPLPHQHSYQSLNSLGAAVVGQSNTTTLSAQRIQGPDILSESCARYESTLSCALLLR
jgi:hypothetical protein